MYITQYCLLGKIEDANTWNDKGNSLYSLGRHEEAIACCDEAIKLDPENYYALSWKATGLGSLEKYEEAIACYDKLIMLDPEDTIAWYHKGDSLKELGRVEEAKQCSAKVKELQQS